MCPGQRADEESDSVAMMLRIWAILAGMVFWICSVAFCRASMSRSYDCQWLAWWKSHTWRMSGLG